MSYVDGFVVPIRLDRLDDYRRMAELGRTVWMEHGALDYQEYIADDVPDGKVTSFPMSVKLEPGEVVGFAYARYRSREHRDEVMKKVMEDPRMDACKDPRTMPFDGQRLIWGGFRDLLDPGGRAAA